MWYLIIGLTIYAFLIVWHNEYAKSKSAKKALVKVEQVASAGISSRQAMEIAQGIVDAVTKYTSNYGRVVSEWTVEEYCGFCEVIEKATNTMGGKKV